MDLFVNSSQLKAIEDRGVIQLISGVVVDQNLPSQNLNNALLKIQNTLNEARAVFAETAEVFSRIHVMLSEAAAISHEFDARLLEDLVVIVEPFNLQSVSSCKALINHGLETSLGPCYSPEAGLIAAKTGAGWIYIPCQDNEEVMVKLISELFQVYENYPDIMTRVMLTNLTSSRQLVLGAKLGVNAALITASLLDQILE